MPIDPSIPLSVRVPQPVDSMENMVRMIQLRNAMAQSQRQAKLTDQEIEASKALAEQRRMQVQRERQEQADDRTFQDEFTKAGGNFDQAIKAATPKMAYSSVQKHMKGNLDYERSLSELENSKKIQLANTTAILGPELESLLETPPQDRGDAWSGFLTLSQRLPLRMRLPPRGRRC